MEFRKLGALLAAGCFASVANAGAIISDGNVLLGVDDLGQLNEQGGPPSINGATIAGVRYVYGDGAQYESTSYGCLCEGWGVSSNDGSGATAGFANNAIGTAGLTSESFSSTAVSAVSVVTTTDGNLRVTHSFALSSATDNLYEVTVTIEALVAVTDVRYRRTMDWDTDPTPFDEYVTIGGTASASTVLAANDNGFCSSNPLSFCGQILASGDFVDSGPADHGANFDFGFGNLAAGETYTFSIFYGGAASLAEAFTAMGAAGIEVYSLGRSALDLDGDGLSAAGARTPTFIFGFKGVGGTSVPEPGTLALLGLGLIGLVASRRRRLDA